ncbi:class III aminotransferase [Medicago truncatula]|uniref:Class III aminotransferase n=1 Tax=Medicago truncatula TaxID=3880 RepID=A0A072UXX3_MEDTR|nr:class III aminotransferase [Medicago truncatula]
MCEIHVGGALRFLSALEWVHLLNLGHVDFELDANRVVDSFKSHNSDASEFGNIINKCKTLFSNFYENSSTLSLCGDKQTRRYLDAFGGIATVSCGHCHPDVVEAIVDQTRLLQHTTVLYLNHNVVDFGEALAAKMPGELKLTCRINQHFSHQNCNS